MYLYSHCLAFLIHLHPPISIGDNLITIPKKSKIRLKGTYLDYPVGKLKNNVFMLGRFVCSQYHTYGTMGHYMYHDGWFNDGVRYSRIDRSLYGIGEIVKETTLNGESSLCEIYLKEFTNTLFKRSINFTHKGGAISDTYGSDLTNEIEIPDSAAPDPIFEYAWGGVSSILTTKEGGDLTHAPSWLYKNYGSDSEIEHDGLINDDGSIQGAFGHEGIKSENWMAPSGVNNSYGGSYLIREGKYATYIITGTGLDGDGVSVNGWYEIVDSTATGTARVWKHITHDYWIRYDSESLLLYVLTDTSLGAVSNGLAFTPLSTPLASASSVQVYGTFTGTADGDLPSLEVNQENEQVLRVLNDIPVVGEGLFMRGLLDKIDLTASDTSGSEYVVSGDTFSIGNVFGEVYPDVFSKSVRIFFDVDESMSGIASYRYFIQQIETDSVQVSQYIGNVDSSALTDDKHSVIMQTLNNKEVDYNDLSSSEAYADENDVISYRSPDVVNQYYLANSSNSTWTAFTTTVDKLTDTNDTGYGTRRLYCDIAVPNIDYSMIYFQLKDKAGNISDMYPVAINVLSNNTTISSQSIYSASIAVDDGLLSDYTETITDGDSDSYIFDRGVPRDDQDASKSIVVRDLLYKDESGDDPTYEKYTKTNDLLIGFSDDYGLTYNRFVPFTSINTWDFSRPVYVQCKNFFKWARLTEPDWFFDPNDIRHYRLESEDDANVLPGNSGEIPITIIGLMEEGGDDWNVTKGIGKSNPIAKKIYEHKEEIIGKKIALGGDLSQKFVITHIFKSNEIHAVQRVNATFTENIDGSSRMKVWIVVEDPDAICAMGLSRRFQNYPGSAIADDGLDPNDIRTYTGWKNFASSLNLAQEEAVEGNDVDYTRNAVVGDHYGDKTYYFGYPLKSEVETEVVEIVDNVLGLDPENSNSMVTNNPYSYTKDEMEEYSDWKTSCETFYIDLSDVVASDSGIGTGEGWLTRIFKRYELDSNKTGDDAYNLLRQHNIVGLECFDRFVFGESYTVDCYISEKKDADSAVFLSSGKLDASMGGGTSDEGFEYTINRIDTSSNSVEVDSGKIIDVSEDGTCVVVDGDLDFTIDLVLYTYKMSIVVSPLQSDANSEWRPSVGGSILIPESGSTLAKDLDFVQISSGSFYISEDGYYKFKIEVDDSASSDFSVDFMGDASGASIVTGLVYIDGTGYVDDVTVGGKIKANSDIDVPIFLKKGWHIGRFRYNGVIEKYNRYVRLLWQKPGWGSDEWIPFMASRNNGNKAFLKKAARSIHCKIIDKYNNKYPLDNVNASDRDRSSQYMRAISGFNGLSYSEPISFADRAVWVARNAAAADGNLVHGRTYGSQVFEEAYGIYHSNIFDGGVDLRFWRELKWNPNTQPVGTTVEFYIRTAATEQEILLKKWNNVGTDTNEVILPAFTDSVSNNILRFTNQISSLTEEVIINRFIQFRMVLKSRNQSVSPKVNDVTLVYSRENSVNFYTTTFSLGSNLLRAILTYNGESGTLDANGVAMSDIQFGICTTEESDGTVSTNFDDYTSIPVNEAFDLSNIGVLGNDKFRIGIRFISSSDQVPSVDEIASIWETVGDKELVKNIKANIVL